MTQSSASEVMRHHLDGQPSGVGWEAARGEMVQPHAVLEVANGILDLGVAAMVGLQIQGVARSISDEGVIAVVGKQRQFGGLGLNPPCRLCLVPLRREGERLVAPAMSRAINNRW